MLVNGEKDGEWTWYYNDGQVKTRGIYENGKENGLFSWYYAGGILRAEGEKVDGNGLITHFDETGKAISESVYENHNVIERRSK